MIPTRLQIKTRFRALLDDPNGATFDDAVFTEAFSEAYDVLFNEALNAQVPRIQIISNYSLPVLTTSLTPATAGIADFGELNELEERLDGSQEKYTHVSQWNKLPQRNPVDRLMDFTWHFDTFYFVGANTPRDLRITYESSGTAPTNDNASINWDGALPFLSLYAAGAAGPRKGYDELASIYILRAVGPRFNDGILGGELKRLLAPAVRSMQNVPVAMKPYSVYRGRVRRRVPYVQAQQPAGVSVAPVQFSTTSGTITGTIDGANAIFFLSYPVATANVYRNGMLMTQTVDVTFGANQLVFQAGQIPVAGDVLTVEGWV